MYFPSIFVQNIIKCIGAVILLLVHIKQKQKIKNDYSKWNAKMFGLVIIKWKKNEKLHTVGTIPKSNS